LIIVANPGMGRGVVFGMAGCGGRFVMIDVNGFTDRSEKGFGI
jgi:hypothetical protein